jgi:hypothetical protein
MKWNMLFGALVVSVGLCSQSFGFELLDRMLGINGYGGGGGCSSCCEPTCCSAEPTCCAAAPSCCEPTCAAPACEPTCCEAAPSCCDPCNTCNSCNSCCKKKCHLFGGLGGLFDCHKCKKSCCAPACEPTCCEAAPSCCSAEPTCCDAAPSCGDPCNSCCNTGCCKKKCGGLLGLFKCHKSCNSCNTCCSSPCNSCAGGCSSCGDAAPAAAPAAADAAGDVPPSPPIADQSASIQGKRRVVRTSAVSRR